MNERINPPGQAPHFVLCRADKRPIQPGWQREPATAQEARAHKRAGGLVGLIPGSLDYAVIDIDEGDPAAVIEALGEPAFQNTTRRGGTHLWYAVPPGRSPVRNGKWRLDGAEGDIRGDRGFVVLWTAGTVAALQEESMFAAPLDMARLDAMRDRRQATDPDADTWPEGERNESFNRAVHEAARHGDTAGVAAAIAKARESGLPEGEIRATLASAVMAGARDYTPPVTAADFPDDAPEDAGGLGFRPAAALFEHKDPPKWLAEELLPRGGTSLVYGRPKSGKSTLARHAAYCTAKGLPFLGRAVRGGPVLYVAMQDSVSEFDAAMVRLGMDAADPFYSAVLWQAPADARDRLARDIVELQPALVVLDMLGNFLRTRDLNDYAPVVRALAPFSELARTTGAHIAFLHHSNKGESEDMGVRALGSTGLEGTVDTLLELSRGQHGERYVETRQRYGVPLDKTELQFEPATGRFDLGQDFEESRLDSGRKAVRAALESGPLNATALRKAIALGVETVDSAIADMVRHAELKVVRKGREKIYSLVPDITKSDFDDA